jgi:hypothetical protein
MVLSARIPVIIFAVLIGVHSAVAQNGKGEYVTVEGQRVFVPAEYIDKRTPRRMPEKLARDILRGRRVISSGRVTTSFKPSRVGTEIAISGIRFDEGEPQTLSEQIPYFRERVEAFNRILHESEMPLNDTVAGSGAAMLIAMRVLGKPDALGESKKWQEKYRQTILNSEAYQGRPDEERQANYEIEAFFAVEALNEVKKAKAAKNPTEREAAQRKAREYAQSVYQLLTEGWPETSRSAAKK